MPLDKNKIGDWADDHGHQKQERKNSSCNTYEQGNQMKEESSCVFQESAIHIKALSSK